jgi:hypothetical protein
MNSPIWYVRKASGPPAGPFTPQQLKSFADSGKLPRTAHISKTTDGPWSVAESVKGLFAEKVIAEQEYELKAGDLVPDAVKKSATQLGSAMANVSKGMLSKIKTTAIEVSQEAQNGENWLDRFCLDGQDQSVVTKTAERVKQLCTTNEEIMYIAVQAKIGLNLSPDCIALTNKRFIIFRAKMFGRSSFFDCLWKECKNVHMEENLIGATIIFESLSSPVIEKIDSLPKAQARAVYRIAQEQEEKAIADRRNLRMEELQAQANKTIINQAIGVPANNPDNSIVAKMEQLKSLLASGLITQEEFEEKRKKLIDSI